METRSGELISGAIAVAVAGSSITAPSDTKVFQVMQTANAMPEWAAIAVLCGLFGRH